MFQHDPYRRNFELSYDGTNGRSGRWMMMDAKAERRRVGQLGGQIPKASELRSSSSGGRDGLAGMSTQQTPPPPQRTVVDDAQVITSASQLASAASSRSQATPPLDTGQHTQAPSGTSTQDQTAAAAVTLQQAKTTPSVGETFLSGITLYLVLVLLFQLILVYLVCTRSAARVPGTCCLCEVFCTWYILDYYSSSTRF